MRHKDTGHNVRVTEEFTVNIVDGALVAGMNVCAVPFPADIDELAMAGLTAIKGVHVAWPRIAEAPAALECRRYMTIAVGKSREIILGLVLGCFVREGVVNPITKHVDQRKMDAIGRLGGMDICAAATNSIFQRCQWTSGDAVEAIRLAPMANADPIRCGWREICFVRRRFGSLPAACRLRGTA